MRHSAVLDVSAIADPYSPTRRPARQPAPSWLADQAELAPTPAQQQAGVAKQIAEIQRQEADAVRMDTANDKAAAAVKKASAAAELASQNSAAQAQMRGTGQRFYTDPATKRVVPVTRPDGGGVFTPSAVPSGVDAETGYPLETVTDATGAQTKRHAVKFAVDKATGEFASFDKHTGQRIRSEDPEKLILSDKMAWSAPAAAHLFNQEKGKRMQAAKMAGDQADQVANRIKNLKGDFPDQFKGVTENAMVPPEVLSMETAGSPAHKAMLEHNKLVQQARDAKQAQLDHTAKFNELSGSNASNFLRQRQLAAKSGSQPQTAAPVQAPMSGGTAAVVDPAQVATPVDGVSHPTYPASYGADTASVAAEATKAAVKPSMDISEKRAQLQAATDAKAGQEAAVIADGNAKADIKSKQAAALKDLETSDPVARSSGIASRIQAVNDATEAETAKIAAIPAGPERDKAIMALQAKHTAKHSAIIQDVTDKKARVYALFNAFEAPTKRTNEQKAIDGLASEGMRTAKQSGFDQREFWRQEAEKTAPDSLEKQWRTRNGYQGEVGTDGESMSSQELKQMEAETGVPVADLRAMHVDYKKARFTGTYNGPSNTLNDGTIVVNPANVWSDSDLKEAVGDDGKTALTPQQQSAKDSALKMRDDPAMQASMVDSLASAYGLAWPKYAEEHAGEPTRKVIEGFRKQEGLNEGKWDAFVNGHWLPTSGRGLIDKAFIGSVAGVHGIADQVLGVANFAGIKSAGIEAQAINETGANASAELATQNSMLGLSVKMGVEMLPMMLLNPAVSLGAKAVGFGTKAAMGATDSVMTLGTEGRVGKALSDALIEKGMAKGLAERVGAGYQAENYAQLCKLARTAGAEVGMNLPARVAIFSTAAMQSLGAVQNEASQAYFAQDLNALIGNRPMESISPEEMAQMRAQAHDSSMAKARPIAGIAGVITGVLTTLLPKGSESLERKLMGLPAEAMTTSVGVMAEKIGMKALAQYLNGKTMGAAVGNFLGRIGIHGFDEALEEGLDQFGQEVMASLTYDKKRTFGQILASTLEGAALGAIMGMTTGGISGGRNQSQGGTETAPVIPTAPAPEDIAGALTEIQANDALSDDARTAALDFLDGGAEISDEAMAEIEQVAPEVAAVIDQQQQFQAAAENNPPNGVTGNPVNTNSQSQRRVTVTDLSSEEGSPYMRADITAMDGTQGHVSVKKTSDGRAVIADIQIGYNGKEGRGKGYGYEAFLQIGEQLARKGITLESTQGKEGTGISPQALAVWAKLERDGFAVQTGMADVSIYNREEGKSEGVKRVPGYEFVSKSGKSADSTSQDDIGAEILGNLTPSEIQSSRIDQHLKGEHIEFNRKVTGLLTTRLDAETMGGKQQMIFDSRKSAEAFMSSIKLEAAGRVKYGINEVGKYAVVNIQNIDNSGVGNVDALMGGKSGQVSSDGVAGDPSTGPNVPHETKEPLPNEAETAVTPAIQDPVNETPPVELGGDVIQDQPAGGLGGAETVPGASEGAGAITKKSQQSSGQSDLGAGAATTPKPESLKVPTPTTGKLSKSDYGHAIETIILSLRNHLGMKDPSRPSEGTGISAADVMSRLEQNLSSAKDSYARSVESGFPDKGFMEVIKRDSKRLAAMKEILSGKNQEFGFDVISSLYAKVGNNPPIKHIKEWLNYEQGRTTEAANIGSKQSNGAGALRDSPNTGSMGVSNPETGGSSNKSRTIESYDELLLAAKNAREKGDNAKSIQLLTSANELAKEIGLGEVNTGEGLPAKATKGTKLTAAAIAERMNPGVTPSKAVREAAAALAAELDRRGSVFKGIFAIKAKDGTGLGVDRDTGALEIDFARLAKTARTTGENAKTWAKRALTEEVIHAIGVDMANKKIWKPKELFESLPKVLQEKIRASYKSSSDPVNLGHEFLRMVVQGKMDGELTELTPEAYGKVRQAVLDLLDYLKQLMKTLKGTAELAEVNKLADMVTARIKAMDAARESVDVNAETTNPVVDQNATNGSNKAPTETAQSNENQSQVIKKAPKNEPNNKGNTALPEAGNGQGVVPTAEVSQAPEAGSEKPADKLISPKAEKAGTPAPEAMGGQGGTGASPSVSDIIEKAHEFTPKQFREAAVKAGMDETGDSRKEIEQGYTKEWADDLHWIQVIKAAKNGSVIRSIVLDKLEPMQREYLSKHSPKSIPTGYVNPEARATNTEFTSKNSAKPAVSNDTKPALTAAEQELKDLLNDLEGGTLQTQSLDGGKSYSVRDADYLAAVERGDKEVARKFLDEAAVKAGFSSLRQWHGSRNGGFSIFDTEEIGKNQFTGPPVFGFGFSFADRDQAMEYGRVSSWYLRLGRVFNFDEDLSDKDRKDIEMATPKVKRHLLNLKSGKSVYTSLVLASPESLSRADEKEGLHEGTSAAKWATNILIKAGFDSAIATVTKGQPSETTIFHAEDARPGILEIKEGSRAIALSERFPEIKEAAQSLVASATGAGENLKMVSGSAEGGPKETESQQSSALQSQALTPTYTAPIPVEKLGVFISVAQKLIAEGVNTPHALATTLDKLSAAKVTRKYAEAIWSGFRMVDPSLPASPDWQGIYDAMDKPKAPSEQSYQEQIATMNEFLKTATDPDQIRHAKDIIATAEFMLRDSAEQESKPTMETADGEKPAEVTPEEQIRKHLDNDDPSSALKVFDVMTKKDIDKTAQDVFGRGFYNNTRSEMLSALGEWLPQGTRSALAKVAKNREIATAQSALDKAKRGQKSHMEGKAGMPGTDQAMRMVSEAEGLDPHGIGRDSVAKAWQKEVDDAQVKFDEVNSPRTEKPTTNENGQENQSKTVQGRQEDVLSTEAAPVESAGAAETIEIGDEVLFSDPNRPDLKAVKVIAGRVDKYPDDKEQMVSFDYFGMKRYPLSTVTLSKKSLQRERREAKQAAVHPESYAAVAEIEKTVEASAKVTKQADKEAGKPDLSAVKMTAQKKYLIDAVAEAIKEAPMESPGVEAGKDGGLMIKAKSDGVIPTSLLEKYKVDEAIPLEELTTEDGITEDALKYLRNKSDKPSKAIAVINGREKVIPLTEAGRIEILNQKISEAIQKQLPKVVIEVPGDGIFRIVNNKKALTLFARRAKAFPVKESAPTKDGGLPKPTVIPALGKPKNFLDQVKIAALSVSEDPTRAVLHNVLSDGESLVSTNGRMLMEVRSKESKGSPQEPVSIDPATGKVTQTNGKIPAWNQVIPKTFEQTNQIDTGVLYKLLVQATKILSGFNGKGPTVTLWVDSSGNVGVTGTSMDGDSYSGGSDPETSKVLASYDADYLMTGIKGARMMGLEKVALKTSAESAMMIEGDGFRFVLMPVRTEGGVTSSHPDMQPERPLLGSGSRVSRDFGIPMGRSTPIITSPSPSITDVTPEGFGPKDTSDEPVIEQRLKGETLDDAINRKIGYQVENGRVKIEHGPNGWTVTVVQPDGNPRKFTSVGKQQAVNKAFEDVYPNTRLVEAITLKERDSSKPEQMTPEELAAFERKRKINSAKDDLEAARKGTEQPNIYTNGTKSKAALVKKRTAELKSATESKSDPDIWGTVIDAAYKKAPISELLINGLSDKSDNPDIRTIRQQAIDSISNHGYVKSGEFYIHTENTDKGTALYAQSLDGEQDADYLAAVESGDMETAQRMVDAAAKAVGYGTKAWHGSDVDFTTFDINRAGRTGMEAGPGFYFADNQNQAQAYGKKLKSVYLKIRTPLTIRGSFQNAKISDALGGSMDRKTEYPELARSKGYDAIIRYDINDNNKLRDIVIHNPSQIKSANPVTRDDQGKVIPLSQRFNPESNSILYAQSLDDNSDPLENDRAALIAKARRNTKTTAAQKDAIEEYASSVDSADSRKALITALTADGMDYDVARAIVEYVSAVTRKAKSSGPTSIKNAVVYAERKYRNADEILKVAAKSNQVTFDEAKGVLSGNQEAGEQLTDEILRGKDSVNEVDHAVLLIDRGRIWNELNRQADLASDLTRTKEERLRSSEIAMELESRMHANDMAAELSGRSAGRTLQARKMMMALDFTLEGMTRMRRKAKGGPLTMDEIEALKETFISLEKHREALAAKEAEYEAALLALKESHALELMKAEAGSIPEADRELLSRVKKAAMSGFAAVKSRIQARLSAKKSAALSAQSLGLDPDIVDAAARLRIDGASTPEKLRERMVSEFGEDVTDIIGGTWEELFSESEQAVEDIITAAAGGKSTPAVKKSVTRRVTKPDEEGLMEHLEGVLASRIESGDSLDQASGIIHKIALELVRSGIDNAEDLLRAVHRKVTKLLPDTNIEVTRDIISGYGVYKELDPEPAKNTLRQIKGEFQQAAKIRDMKAAIDAGSNINPLKPTGVERRTPSDEERALIKQVNELKKQGKFVSTSKNQLRTTQDAIKTRLQNEIRDMDNAIAEMKPILRSKGKLEYSDENKALMAQRDARRAEYLKIFPRVKQELTDAQRSENLAKSLDRSIARVTEEIAKGKIYADTKKAVAMSPAMQAARAKLDALMADRQVLRDLDTTRVEETRVEKLKQSIEELDRKITEKEVAPRKGVATVDTPEVAALKVQRSNKQAEMRKIQAALKPRTDLAILTAHKASLARRIEEMTARLARPDLSSTKTRQKADVDAIRSKLSEKAKREIDGLRETLKNAELEFKNANAMLEWKKMTRWQRIMARVSQVNRFNVLSGISSIEHLAGAGLENIITRPVGTVTAQLMRLAPWTNSIRKKAVYEGGFSTKAEWKGAAATLTSAKAVWQKVVHGKSSIDTLYGDGKVYPKEWLEIAGNIHGAIKEPVRQGIFARTVQLEWEAAEKAGLDPQNDKLVQSAITSNALINANREIFMGDNIVTRVLFRSAMSALRGEKNHPTVAKFLAAVLDLIMPVVNVPTNIAIRKMQLALGFPIAIFRVGMAATRGELANKAEKLSQAEAELITRLFKYGLIGLALAAYAWHHDDEFGGVYVPGENAKKAKKPTLKPGDMDLFGVLKINKHFGHGPWGSYLNLIADARKMYDQREAEGERNPIVGSALFAIMAGIKDIPILNAMGRWTSGRPAEEKFGEQAGHMLIPQLVSNIAEGMDPVETRDPTTFMDEIKKRIPVLRETIKAKQDGQSVEGLSDIYSKVDGKAPLWAVAVANHNSADPSGKGDWLPSPPERSIKGVPIPPALYAEYADSVKTYMNKLLAGLPEDQAKNPTALQIQRIKNAREMAMARARAEITRKMQQK